MLRLIIEDTTGRVLDEIISNGAIVAFVLAMAAFYITFYVLRSLGLYTLAKNQGVEKAYLAFIPCVWMFTACKIIGNSKMFGKSASEWAIWACVIFSAATILPLADTFLRYFPFVMYYLEGGEVSIISGSSTYIGTGSDFINHFDTQAIKVILNILSILNNILSLAEIFICVTVYIALFRKFWPEHYILAAVLSFFRLFPILVFAIRNKKSVDFSEYIRRRYYGSGYTPYGNNNYGQGGQNNYYGGYSEQNEEPFDEFSGRPEEPFGEFSGNKTKFGKSEDSESKSDKNDDDYYQ